MSEGGVMMNSIEVNRLTKKYGDYTAVDHISFQVEKGSLLGFLGINGAGKNDSDQYVGHTASTG